MQIDLFSEFPPSGGYQNIFTAEDLFSTNAIVYPVFNLKPKDTGNIILDMTRHAYLPVLILTEKGSIFVYHIIQEVAEMLCIHLN